MNITAIIFALGVMAVLGVIFGGVLTVADKKFAVETDPRVSAVRECLGGANCGACGFAGCDAFAEAVVAGEAPANGCTPGGAKCAERIAGIMGVATVDSGVRNVARVLCQGTCGIAKERYEYDGYQSCAVAAGLAGGPKECRFACLGLGDCVKACAFDAIKITDGVADIDEDKCVACGKCAIACPRSVISLKPVNETVIVSCRNTDPGRVARQACTKACIACGRCTKECPSDAIHVENGVAKIDESKCTRCGACAKVCPCKCIVDFLA